MGDFNLPHVNWTIDDNTDNVDFAINLNMGNALLPSGSGCGVKAELLHTFMNHGLHQLNDIRNFQGRILDLVFSNETECLTISKADPLSKVDAFHDPLNIVIPVRVCIPTENTESNNSGEYSFRKADYTELNSYLQTTDWTSVLTTESDVNEMVGKFYDILINGFNAFIPLKRAKTNDHPPWFTKRIAQIKNRLSNAHRRYKKTRENSDYLKFCLIRNELQTSQENAYRAYKDDIENNFVNDPYKFWSYVKNKKKSDGFPSHMKFGDKKGSQRDELTNMFADFFQSVYANDDALITDGNVEPSATAG